MLKVLGCTFMLPVLAACSLLSEDGPVRDDSGSVVESGDEDAIDLQLGDCFDTPGTEVVEKVTVVPCTEPHQFEVYHTFELPDGPFPGSESIGEQWLQGCLAEFEAFVGVPFDQSMLDISGIFPTEQTWADLDDREVLCSVTPVDGEMRTGSARGSRV